MVHILHALPFLWHIDVRQKSRLVLLDDVVQNCVVDVGTCEVEGAPSVLRCHNPVIVYIYFVDTVVHVDSIRVA